MPLFCVYLQPLARIMGQAASLQGCTSLAFLDPFACASASCARACLRVCAHNSSQEAISYIGNTTVKCLQGEKSILQHTHAVASS
jgi:hypothetical protein